MCRIIINLLLLMSIAAAAPDGRPKRHFSYVKNFILSNFFGDNITPSTETLIMEPEFDYELYKIPGYNDLLIKTLKCKPGEITIVDNSVEEIKIKPFESYMGTKSIKETGKAFRNVYKLLATRILNEPKINIFQTMVPIINGLYHKTGDHMKPLRVHPNKKSVIRYEEKVKKKPAQMDINNNKNNLKRPFKTILKNPLKKRLPVNSYHEKINEQINVRNAKLPIFFEHIPHTLCPLPTNSNHFHKGENHLYNIKQFVRLEPDNFKNNFDHRLVPLESMTFPSTHLKKPVYVGVVAKDEHDKQTLDDRKKLKSIGSTPTLHDFLSNDDSTTEDIYSKTNNSRATSTDKINSNIYFPNNKNVPQINHKHSDNFGIVKENDVVSTQSPFNIKVSPLTTTTKKFNNKTIDESITEHKHNVSNVVKINNNLPKSDTLSQRVYEYIRYNNTDSHQILKEKESKVHTKLGTDASLPKIMIHLPIIEKSSINVHNTKSNDIKNQTKEDLTITTTKKTKDAYEHAFGDEKFQDYTNTSKNNYSLYNSPSDNSSKSNYVEASDGHMKNNDENINVIKSNNIQVSIVPRNDSDINVHFNDTVNNIVANTSLVKTNNFTTDVVPNDAYISQLHNEQSSNNDPSQPFGTFESENQAETNVHTNSPLPQEDSFISPVIDTDPQETFGKTLSYNPEFIDNENIFNLDLDGNAVKTNAFSNTPISTYNDSTQPITNSPLVNFTVDDIGDNKDTSTTESATTTSATELFYESDIGPVSPVVETGDFENENQSQNFSESFTKDRGDIPLE